MKKVLTSFLFIMLILECSYAQENKETESSERNTYKERAYEISPTYKETRKIKYLLQEPTGVIVFFDNNKATSIKGFQLCKEKMDILYLEPSEYTYELMGDIITFSKREDKYAVGIRLSSEYWMIKDYVPIVEVPNCNK